MSKESYYALALGVAAIIGVVLQMMYSAIPLWIGWTIIATLGAGAISLVVRGRRKGEKTLREDKTSSHNGSASRVFTIDIGNCHILESSNPSKLEMVIHTLTLTAYPSQTIEGIFLYLRGEKYEETTGAFMHMGKELFQHSPMFGTSVNFEIPGVLKKGTYSAQIIVYVDGREETQDFKFKY